MNAPQGMRPLLVFCLTAILLLVVSACSTADVEAPPADVTEAEATAAPEAETGEESRAADEPSADASGRTGAWVDEVIVLEEPSAAAAVTRLEVGEIDAYAFAVTDPEVFQSVNEASDLTYAESFGAYSELTFNPAGPVFEGTGELNPFAVPRVREAMNWLVDRDFIVEEIHGGLALPRYLPITGSFPDYARLVDVARQLELRYAHDPARAEEVISAEMEALGAEMVDGTWHYEGEPVELTVLIRTEDERRDIGDYVSSLLEDIGFVVERDYRTAAEASPIWIRGNPDDGEFHIYTGGWVTTVVSRDQSGNFNFFYTPRGLAFPLWQAYTPAEEFDELADRLANRDFETLEERRELFSRALELSMQDSVRIWLVDRLSISPYRNDVSVAANLAGGINGSWLWASTIQRAGETGGTINIAMPSILPEPWNPLDGSNWVYDSMLYRGTGDLGVISDPYTGLNRPQRIERAEVFIRDGLPVAKTLNWVELNFVPENEVPEDAWINWDPVEQRFITVGEQHPEGLTANVKSVAYYPASLNELTWHDGSPFSVADVVMNLILTFDRGMEESAIYDEAQVPPLETFLDSFRGARIVQTDPLVIEYYSDQYFLDAEQNVTTLFPQYNQGPGAWHALGVGILAEENEELAFSSAKADALEVEWMNMIAGPSLEILEGYLAQASADDYIPYEPTLGEYISAEEVQARWENLQSWYDEKGHFWVGTGAFFLEEAFPIEGTVQLLRNPEYPDASDKWSRFEEPMIATVELDGPGRVSAGESATYDVFVDFDGEPYPLDQIDEVKYLIFDAQGELALTGQAEPVDDGLYEIVLDAEQVAQLETGANRLEVAVVPRAVSIPSFSVLEFATVP